MVVEAYVVAETGWEEQGVKVCSLSLFVLVLSLFWFSEMHLKLVVGSINLSTFPVFLLVLLLYVLFSSVTVFVWNSCCHIPQVQVVASGKPEEALIHIHNSGYNALRTQGHFSTGIQGGTTLSGSITVDGDCCLNTPTHTSMQCVQSAYMYCTGVVHTCTQMLRAVVECDSVHLLIHLTSVPQELGQNSMICKSDKTTFYSE